MSNELAFWIPGSDASLDDVAHDLYLNLSIKLDQPNRVEGIAFTEPVRYETGRGIYLESPNAELMLEIEESAGGAYAFVSTADDRKIRFVDEALDGIFEKLVSYGTQLEHTAGRYLTMPSNLNEARHPDDAKQFERGFEGVY